MTDLCLLMVAIFEIYFYSYFLVLIGLNNFNSPQHLEYGYSLVFLNIFFYVTILLLIFSIFFLFNTQKKKTISDLKQIAGLPFVGFSFFLSLLSLAGVPPLSGFSVKFLTFMYICLFDNFYVIAYFAVLNFFFLFFYIQNIRVLTTAHELETAYFYNKNGKAHMHQPLVFVMLILNSVNVSSIFFLEDMLLYSNYMFSTVFF